MTTRRWAYNEQGPPGHDDIVVVVTEREVLESERLRRSRAGIPDADDETVIDDFVAVYWAWEVT